ncbi:tetratricopeptide repeat protein [Synoicihabitans lomoniglobus]|uniref:Tetratricopeptide repeat protein n=1 Tax=Synoicihabitans lomoniglobus TaxID=2909285 RepID=A0AAF0CP82_9BACT|nr:tetratricopeptide repeat protein [Opitutaceae bacterium LMO-M01]WED65600.1 tetratricopeptide repeat protein [Opitutaceae bacterium LMO-M01]
MSGLSRGQNVATDPALPPLMGTAEAPGDPVPGFAREGAARRALEMGFPSVATRLYAELVAAATDPVERDRLILDGVMALFEADRIDEAATAMLDLSVPNGPRSRLRRGLIAMARGDVAGADAALVPGMAATLPVNERAWFHYLVGAIAGARDEPQLARRAYANAIAAATSGLQRARFELADLRSSWHVSQPTPEQASRLLRRWQEYEGEQIGYDSAKRYAAVVAALGDKATAISFLQNQILVLRGGQVAQRDDFRLLLGLIAGADNDMGRNALLRLLAEGAGREKQRIALRMLVEGSSDDAQRANLRNEISQLLAETEAHPIEQDLLLFRAQLTPDTTAATRDALSLLERFPASDLRPTALSILVGAAWDSGRYRTAAGYAAQARRELPAGEREVRAQMGLLQAEAFFRGDDFRSAADAYAAALDELPSGVAAGDVVFQEVLARIADNQLTAAATRIDLLATDPRFDVINRWQAEWNLARAMQAQGRAADAYDRVNQLMAELGAGRAVIPDALAVRIAWLQARLALEAGEPEQTLTRAPEVRRRVGSVSPELREEVLSSMQLLEAEAYFALGRHDEALSTLQALRAEHANTEAAVYSYIAEANAQAAQGLLVEAQRLLTELVSTYRDNRYAPFALYQSALMAEGRREDIYLREAIEKIEELVTRYPQSDLVFYARFKQGDLLRKLNEWGSARQAYELIINQYPQHEDVRAAQMALADTMKAQAGVNDRSLKDSAAAIYERLRDLATAPMELRIEAGFKSGHLLSERGRWERAAETWWQVVDEFLLENNDPAALGTRGRYWLARTLRYLGELFERQGRWEEARRSYAVMRDRGLSQAGWAEAQLERLGVRGTVETTTGR